MGELVILIIELAYIHRIKAFNIRKVFTSSRNYLVAGIPMLIIVLLVQKLLPNTLLGLMILICIGGICYGTILFLLRDEFAFKGIDMVKARINKIKKRK